MLKTFCWLTLWGDVCLIAGSLLHGVVGGEAVIRLGEFTVTSSMPGGKTFIIYFALWTGVLAGAVLYLLRQGPSARPNKPLHPPSGPHVGPEGESLPGSARG
jgi:hypothetical protein